MAKDKDFFQLVYEIVRQIPEGRVSTYGHIAKALGSPQSSRMVGWAMNGAHKIEPPVPAHRVVNRLGILSGKAHFSTPNAMQLLLEKEGIEVVDDQIINFKELLWDPIVECEY